MLRNKGYAFGNADMTLCLERPKIKDYVPQMIENLSRVMETSIDRVSVKATTNEKMGFVGKEEGMTAYAVVLISRIT